MSVTLPLAPLVASGLASLRLLALFSTAPFFAHSAVPPRVRLALAVVIAAGLAPALAAPPGLEAGTLAVAALQELLIGACLGVTASLVFAGVGLMAEVASVQGGIGAAAAFDPTSDASSVALGSLARMLALVLFLALDGHHALLVAAVRSFELAPAGPTGLASLLGRAAGLGADVFETALRLAAPFTAALLLANVLMGVLGRVIPQLNLMSLQLPAQIAITLGLLAAAAAPFADVLASAIQLETERLLGTLVGGAW